MWLLTVEANILFLGHAVRNNEEDCTIHTPIAIWKLIYACLLWFFKSTLLTDFCNYKSSGKLVLCGVLFSLFPFYFFKSYCLQGPKWDALLKKKSCVEQLSKMHSCVSLLTVKCWPLVFVFPTFWDTSWNLLESVLPALNWLAFK